ncbi:hypothetical protein D3C80_1268830 [compost metagenome]
MTGIAKAAAGPQMAGRANRISQNQQRIVIAIRCHADYVQEITGAFTLGPQTLFGAREKGHFLADDRLCQCLLVHITEHQHFARHRMLHNHRQ